jgi:EAL domain-containing protein (putative c-di-GMP-specific phosphodiesterase class I)
VNTVLNMIKETGINGRNLELEITESIMIDNFEIVNENLKELRSVGIQISLDDFGTGYSSFYRLMELNIDTLKIDQYFINKIKDTNKDSLITRDIISIAHRLGLKTVAEGVESEIQKDYLLEYDCDKLQGYLFSKPVPEEEAVMLLNKYNLIKI